MLESEVGCGCGSRGSRAAERSHRSETWWEVAEFLEQRTVGTAYDSMT